MRKDDRKMVIFEDKRRGILKEGRNEPALIPLIVVMLVISIPSILILGYDLLIDSFTSDTLVGTIGYGIIALTFFSLLFLILWVADISLQPIRIIEEMGSLAIVQRMDRISCNEIIRIEYRGIHQATKKHQVWVHTLQSDGNPTEYPPWGAADLHMIDITGFFDVLHKVIGTRFLNILEPKEGESCKVPYSYAVNENDDEK